MVSNCGANLAETPSISAFISSGVMEVSCAGVGSETVISGDVRLVGCAGVRCCEAPFDGVSFGSRAFRASACPTRDLVMDGYSTVTCSASPSDTWPAASTE